MTDSTKLIWIKILHTVIWIFFNVVIFYLLYAVIANRIDARVWICIGLVAAEGLVLVLFQNVCPVTLVARRYSTSRKDNFDIYLPNWLARHNKFIYMSIVFIALLILAYRLLST